jgi:hypothetical protein
MIRNFRTIFGEKAHLTDREWDHIVHRHPEIKKYGRRIHEILALPDLVKISKRDPDVHLYYRFYNDIFNGKYLLVVVNHSRRKVVTMFITDKIKVGEVLWQKK